MGTKAQGGVGELLERGEELDAIRAEAEAVACGEGRAVVIEGPPGIGKTALVAAARAHVREVGLTPLWRRAGLMRLAAREGANTKRFSGRIRGRPLTRGRYRLRLIATDTAKQRSRPRVARFTVLRARRST